MRTDLVDLHILQDDNRGVKSLLYDRQQKLISLPKLGPPKISIATAGTLIELSPVFILMVSDRFLMWTSIRMQLSSG